jgi:hypothetical protein
MHGGVWVHGQKYWEWATFYMVYIAVGGVVLCHAVVALVVVAAVVVLVVVAAARTLVPPYLTYV